MNPSNVRLAPEFWLTRIFELQATNELGTGRQMDGIAALNYDQIRTSKGQYRLGRTTMPKTAPELRYFLEGGSRWLREHGRQRLRLQWYYALSLPCTFPPEDLCPIPPVRLLR